MSLHFDFLQVQVVIGFHACDLLIMNDQSFIILKDVMHPN